MDPDFFPPIQASSVSAIRAAVAQMRRHQGWLDRPSCPYDGATRAGLAELNRALPASVAAAPAPLDPAADDDTDKYETLERDAQQMLRDLKALTTQFEEGDTKERLQYFRVAAGLMERLLGIAERANNIRQMSDFQRAVLDVFDQVLEPVQRTEALRRLEEKTK